MAGRPRRSVPGIDQRRLEYIGMEDDSSEDEGHDDEDVLNGESSEEDAVESPSDEEEPDVDWERDLLTASDGTRWYKRPRGAFPAWRNSVQNYNDGPIGEAKRSEEEGLSKSSLFSLFLTPEIQDRICRFTNTRGLELVVEHNQRHPQRPKVWHELKPRELKAFTGLILLSGVERPKKKPWHELWSKDAAIRISAFPAAMSRDRFYDIMAAIRFDDRAARLAQIEELEEPEGRDRLLPIRDIFQEVVSRFERFYLPGAKLCVDEQMVAFRGSCPFRVYMPNKPKPYGIKIWALVDHSSSYILKLQVYEGRRGNQREARLGDRVVLELIQGYEGTKRGIVADNYFSSFDVMKELLNRRLTYCGTIRKNRRGIPPLATTAAFTGEADLFLFNEDMKCTLLRHIHSRNRVVLLASSAHYTPEVLQIEDGGRQSTLPTIIHYYNCNKGGVDTADQMISNYSGQFPSKRWPVKLMVHLWDCIALNSWVIWRHNNPMWREGKSKRRVFIRALALELICPHVRERAATVTTQQSHVRSAMEAIGVNPSDFASGPFLRVVVDRKRQGRCVWDHKIKKKCKKVRSRCDRCNRFICKRHTTRLCPRCLEDTSEVATSDEDSEAEDVAQ